jgi:hypothetical protein
MQRDHRGHWRVADLLTATGPAARWVARDELPTAITTVWWAEARSRRQPPMPGAMAQIPIKQRPGAGFPGSVPPGRLTDGSGVWLEAA